MSNQSKAVPSGASVSLTDAIEQFDGDRIGRLLTYVRDELAVEYVAVALLLEDANALRTECNQIDAEAFDP